ncbi:MAG: NTPase [Fidelibacterota bacterium]
MRNLLVTGRPGVGKTTLVERVAKSLYVSIGGFWTQEIRERGERRGFRLDTWDGNSGIMSHVDFTSPFNVGKYGVDVRVIDEIGVPAIESALAESNLVVIDELGRMELFSERFRETVVKALDSDAPVLAVIQDRSHPFLDQVRRRTDVEIVRITMENRNALVMELRNRLEQFGESSSGQVDDESLN